MNDQLVSALSNAFFRIFGFLILLPLGWSFFRVGLRAFLSLFLIFVMFSTENLVQLQGKAGDGYWLSELIIGMVISLPVALAVELAGAWGELFDTSRGSQIAQSYDPLSRTQISLMAGFWRYYWWASLLALGAIEAGLIALADSYSVVPVGHFKIENFYKIAQGMFGIIQEQLIALFLGFIPFALVFLCVDIGFGALARVIPRLMVFGEAFLIKTVIGLLMAMKIQEAVGPVAIIPYVRQSLRIFKEAMM